MRNYGGGGGASVDNFIYRNIDIMFNKYKYNVNFYLHYKTEMQFGLHIASSVAYIDRL